MSEVESRAASTVRSGWKKGLPARSLKDAEKAAGKVWAVARRGSAPAEAIAQALNLKNASGSSWDLSIALLRGFGLVNFKDMEVSLTPLGIDILQDADDATRQEARRTAFLKLPAYRDLIEAYGGEELPSEDNIASKLKFEYGKSEDKAVQAARAFVESLKHAGLLDGDRVATTGGNATSSYVPSVLPSAGQAPGANGDVDVTEDEVEEDIEEALDAAWDAEDEEGDHVAEAPDTPSNVTLSMTLDLSKYRSDEVIAILAAIGLARR